MTTVSHAVKNNALVMWTSRGENTGGDDGQDGVIVLSDASASERCRYVGFVFAIAEGA